MLARLLRAYQMERGPSARPCRLLDANATWTQGNHCAKLCFSSADVFGDYLRIVTLHTQMRIAQDDGSQIDTRSKPDSSKNYIGVLFKTQPVCP